MIQSPQTKSSLEDIPPGYRIATGHEDEVLLFLRRWGDTNALIQIVQMMLSLSETKLALDTLARTHGLLDKRIPLHQACATKKQLEHVGVA